jgi:hypothetical protein
MTITIDQKIGAALSSANVTAPAIAALLFEVEKALADAEQNAVATRKASLDPIAFQDAASARASVEIATLTVDRLRAAQSQLIKRYTEVEAAEALSRWQADAARCEKLRDAAAAKFGRVRDLISEMVAIFTEVEAVDRDASRINSSSPPGQRTLQGCELIARNLGQFSQSDKSIVATTQLLGFDGKQAWPLRKPSIAVMASASVAHDARYSGDWASARASGADADQKQPTAMQRYYESLDRDQAARRLREDLEDRMAKRRSA